MPRPSRARYIVDEQLPASPAPGTVLAVDETGALVWIAGSETDEIPTIGPEGSVLAVQDGAPAWVELPDAAEPSEPAPGLSWALRTEFVADSAVELIPVPLPGDVLRPIFLELFAVGRRPSNGLVRAVHTVDPYIRDSDAVAYRRIGGGIEDSTAWIDEGQNMSAYFQTPGTNTINVRLTAEIGAQWRVWVRIID